MFVNIFSESNERALYLRSLSNLPFTQQRASTEILGGKYKLAYGAGADIDVFSQVYMISLTVYFCFVVICFFVFTVTVPLLFFLPFHEEQLFQVPDKDISDYMNDSFCVQNDEVLETSEYGEVTLLESPVNIDSKCRPKTRAQVIQKNSLNRLECEWNFL